MFPQDLLTESDIDTLINLLLRSQQSRTREALCFSIGIDPKRLSFLRDSSDSDFFLLLIRYLNEIGDQEALCKLCHKELVPIFNKGTYSLFLSELAGKLNCSQEFRQNYPNNKQPTSSSSSPAPSVSVNPFNQLAKNKLVIGSAIFLIGLAGFSLYNQNSNSFNNPHPTELPVSPKITKDNYETSDKVSTIKVSNRYQVTNQWGGSSAPSNDGGTWVIGSRTDQRVVGIDVKSNDGGQTLNGTITYSGEGPIGFKGQRGRI